MMTQMSDIVVWKLEHLLYQSTDSVLSLSLVHRDTECLYFLVFTTMIID